MPVLISLLPIHIPPFVLSASPGKLDFAELPLDLAHL